MVKRGLRALGVFAFIVPLSCGPEDEPSVDNAGGASGGTSGGGGKSGSGGAGRGGGSSGSGASSGTAGTAGRGGQAGAASGGSAGKGATGGTSSGGSSGRGGDSAGGRGGDGTSGSGGDSGDTGESGEGGEGGAANGDSISWNDDGVISTDTNDFGIQGTWFFETDCDDATPEGLPCTVPNSSLQGPDGQPGWTTSADRVCARGTAAQVINDPNTGMPAYLLQWGLRLGFELNGTTSGARGSYDALMHGLRGLRFDVTSNGAPPTVRVNIITTGTAQSQLDAHFVEIVLPAVNQAILFDDALQGLWVATPIPLDKTELTAVTFQVFTSTSAPKPFDFCISNARVLQ